jgi:hypothetical protein|tara:strand:+ start:117 stop:428 length:312 start_codon:yes stop_codon:yes gene_type:complete
MAGRQKYRLKCQTINKQNKLPCKAKGILMKNGNIRCRIHGGWSSGAKTLEGKIKALKNLRQFKKLNDEEIRTYITDKLRDRNNVNERNAFNADLSETWFAKSQ